MKVKMEIATTAIRERDTVKELVKKANELLICDDKRDVNCRSATPAKVKRNGKNLVLE